MNQTIEQQLDKFDKIKLKTVILNVIKANPELETNVQVTLHYLSNTFFVLTGANPRLPLMRSGSAFAESQSDLRLPEPRHYKDFAVQTLHC